MHLRDLHTRWTLRARGEAVPAHLRDRALPTSVPATSHTVLLDAGLIPDPFTGRHEEELRWMHRADWQLSTMLAEPAAAPGERVDLVFDGIDTVASVRLGDVLLGETANMHRSYRFDITALVGQERQLVVDLTSALGYAERQRDLLGARPAAYPHPLNMVRKMACSFGWDWGPDLQTAGIWRGVRTERWRVARLAGVRPLVRIDQDDTAHVRVHADLERTGAAPAGGLRLRARLGEVEREVSIESGASSAVIDLSVAEPRLWWPVGHGDQPLYDLDLELVDDTGHLDDWHRRIGLRTVALEQHPDEHGTSFTLTVNGRAVFARGANWIPDDHLLTRITPQRLARRLDQALGANLNLLRVWGGGIYESEEFYAGCDQRGLLVWQDFPLACAAYPEEGPIAGELAAEAREQVVRLSAHPSLVVWNGGNENLVGFCEWGWREELDGASWGLAFATELLPSIVAELDPTRPYVPNSPSSPGFDLTEVSPNDPDHGTHHQWQVWNERDYTHYSAAIPRFCAEFGFQGPPTWATTERAMAPEDGRWSKDDPTFRAHQKAADGNGKLDRGLAPHLGLPADFVDWHWATQLNQARAVAYGITHYRSCWPRTAGAVVWQLNDCWPVTSWAAVDGDERPKPLWYALRHAFADRTLAVVHRDGTPTLAMVNDTDRAWAGPVRLRRETFAGLVRAEAVVEVQVPARAVHLVPLPLPVATPEDERAEAVVAELGAARTVHLFVEDVEARLTADPLAVQVDQVDGGYRVHVRARSLARDVTLLVDRLDPDARVDDALVTLPAGATATFHVATSATLDPAAMTTAPVLRTANQLVAVTAGRAAVQ